MLCTGCFSCSSFARSSFSKSFSSNFNFHRLRAFRGRCFFSLPFSLRRGGGFSFCRVPCGVLRAFLRRFYFLVLLPSPFHFLPMCAPCCVRVLIHGNFADSRKVERRCQSRKSIVDEGAPESRCSQVLPHSRYSRWSKSLASRVSLLPHQ